MSDISSFPTITQVIDVGDNWQTFTAAAEIKAGQVVCFNPGEPTEVKPATDTSDEFTAGVATITAASGELVTVAMVGCIAYVANADDTTAINAGSYVKQDDNSVGGTVKVVDTSDTGGATVTVVNNVVGVAIDDISGGGTGRVVIMPISITRPNAS